MCINKGLMKLPDELLLPISSDLIVFNKEIKVNSPKGPWTLNEDMWPKESKSSLENLPSLLGINKRLRRVIGEEFYRKNTFYFRSSMAMNVFLRRLRPDMFNSIRYLRMGIPKGKAQHLMHTWDLVREMEDLAVLELCPKIYVHRHFLQMYEGMPEAWVRNRLHEMGADAMKRVLKNCRKLLEKPGSLQDPKTVLRLGAPEEVDLVKVFHFLATCSELNVRYWSMEAPDEVIDEEIGRLKEDFTQGLKDAGAQRI
ncbi:hypothetical protein BU16DRAFT_554186 [Lophium mytilinum]|uniref:Uncharacterized protein n=1 Tax=Lophium mytilinum TaxID=390894 RepID=A0A6A6RBD3_9PEZI|nr:hypothetical protein BU16DRAFT_554186 [Lophium mytilinum]